MSKKMAYKVSPSDTTPTPPSSTSRSQEQQRQQQEEYELLSQLRLPRLNSPGMPPSLRILVVSNVDLTSASALAEHAISDAREELGGGRVDCIIACGPFCNEEILQKRYLQGRNRRRRNQNNNITSSRASQEQPFRSREMTSALEGLMAATIAQLEAIACRVVYCPHPTDPSTMLSPNPATSNHLRLTPNSHNVQETWLSLAPHVGVCGYCGSTEQQRQDLQGSVEQVRVQHGLEYEEALQRILGLAPPSSPIASSQQISSNSSPSKRKPDTIHFSSATMQAILVTQVGEDKVSPKSTSNKDAFEWPKHHLHFLDSPSSQSSILLNIASAPPSCPPFDQLRGKTWLVAPGSLAQHGDYCLVDVCVVGDEWDGNDNTNGATNGSSSKMYRWKVNAVHHRNLNDTRRRTRPA